MSGIGEVVAVLTEQATGEINPIYAPLKAEISDAAYAGMTDAEIAEAINAKAPPVKEPEPPPPEPNWPSGVMGVPYITEHDVAAARKLK